MSWDSDSIDSLNDDEFAYADYRHIPNPISEYKQADNDIREKDSILRSETIAIENEILTGSFSSLEYNHSTYEN